jgi:ATP-dependent Clp protease ATP-binding subunit ClpA
MTRRGAGDVVGRLTPGAREIHRGAFEYAIRLGHPYIGSEHFLLALAGADHPAGAALRAHGVTPDRVEEQIVRLSGGGLFADLDRNALAAVGIDMDAVCDRVTQSLGPEALHRAGRAAFPERRGRWWDPRRRYVGPGAHRDRVFLPVPPGTGVVQFVKQARLEGQARHDPQIGVEHLALGMLSVTNGLAPVILAALGASIPELRAALDERA